MSALVSEAARRLAGEDARMVVGVIAIGVLLAALLLREMARAHFSGDRLQRVERLHFVTLPLTLIFIGVVTPRIVALLS